MSFHSWTSHWSQRGVALRNSAPSPRKPDSPHQPISRTNTCRGVSHMVPLLGFCALGLGMAPQRVGKINFGHGTVFPPESRPNSLCMSHLHSLVVFSNIISFSPPSKSHCASYSIIFEFMTRRNGFLLIAIALTQRLITHYTDYSWHEFDNSVSHHFGSVQYNATCDLHHGNDDNCDALYTIYHDSNSRFASLSY